MQPTAHSKAAYSRAAPLPAAGRGVGVTVTAVQGAPSNEQGGRWLAAARLCASLRPTLVIHPEEWRMANEDRKWRTGNGEMGQRTDGCCLEPRVLTPRQHDAAVQHCSCPVQLCMCQTKRRKYRNAQMCNCILYSAQRHARDASCQSSQPVTGDWRQRCRKRSTMRRGRWWSMNGQ